MPSVNRARAYAFTNFDTDFDYDPVLDHKDFRYCIYGLETCPDTSREHHQGYVYFDKPLPFSTVKSLLGSSHIEKAKGTIEDNVNYCSKGGKVTKFGKRPRQGDRTDLAELLDRVREQPTMTTKDIANIEPATWARNWRAIEQYQSLYEPTRNWKTEVIYIYGDAGTGKSSTCQKAGAAPLQYDGKFIGGYGGEDIVAFEDVDRTKFTPGSRSFILQLLDRYKMHIPVKGGWRNWKPKTIYFTSNFPPEETFGDIWDEAIARRITQIIHTEKIENFVEN